MFPVVETGSLDLPLIEREAKRFDQVQFGARRQACSAGVAGVPMDLRMNKNNVCRCGSGFCFLRNLEAPLKARSPSKVGSRLSKPSNDSHHAGKADSSKISTPEGCKEGSQVWSAKARHTWFAKSRKVAHAEGVRGIPRFGNTNQGLRSFHSLNPCTFRAPLRGAELPYRGASRTSRLPANM